MDGKKTIHERRYKSRAKPPPSKIKGIAEACDGIKTSRFGGIYRINGVKIYLLGSS